MRYRIHLVTAALCTALLLASAGSWAQISVSVNIAPPPLPVYTQPELPGPGYLWVPGYWAWADGGYYWVPGTWIEPPQPGLLWTPGYWGWTDGAYVWNEGYWAPQVGFYGGVDYGFGYDGLGFAGGYWSHGAFFYNRAVNRIPAGGRFHVYSRPVPQRTHSRASFNGGRGGITAHATAAQLAIGRGRHVAPIAAQRQQEQAAGRNPEFRATANHGRPPVGATARPGQFGARGARGAPAPSGNVHIPERAQGRPAAGPHPAPAAHPTGRPETRPEARPQAPHAAAPHREAQPHQGVPQRPNDRAEAHGPAPAHAAPRPSAPRAAPAEHREPEAKRPPEHEPQQ